ncbi:P-loop containing nucleoside triphosphate hydrolase protein [Nemania sp. NC0429]|nr:P-loop containing nucleoside triphosphate hydrolase protein [Nemania sp. NC0429]
MKDTTPSDPALCSSLKGLVRLAKGAASAHVVSFIEKYLKGTKLIFVVGQSGAGKSTFLREVSGMDIRIGKSRNSGTKNCEICPTIIDGEQYLFIDTPGFGAADMDDMDCFHNIIACLHVLGPVVTVAGLIFVTGGNQERLTAQELKTMQWIQCFCGPDFYRNITIMTNKWDKISEDDFDEAWESMQGMLNENATIAEILHPQKLMTSESNLKHYEGGYIYHHGIVMGGYHPDVPSECLSLRRQSEARAEMAIAMIRNRYKKITEVKLQVVHEMDNNIPWDKTEAAKVLKLNAVDIKLQFRDGIVQVPVKDEQKYLRDESDHGTSQLAPENQGPTDQDQTWLDRVWSWILIAKDAAMFFLKL